MAAIWNPDQYLKFQGPRARPAMDLLAQIDHPSAKVVYDIGCGPGNLTDALKARFPTAAHTGVDNSAPMLEKARAAFPDATWVEADLNSWEAPEPIDVLYANASLHWLKDHATLFPKLMGFLAPNGVMAIQMPKNTDAPSHTLMHQAVVDGPWADKLLDIVKDERRLNDVAQYYDILAPHTAELKIWETDYLQVLEGDNPVAEFTKGSALKPLLDALDEGAARQQFFDAYADLIRAAYPRRADGKTLFPFKRLFIVATKPASL